MQAHQQEMFIPPADFKREISDAMEAACADLVVQLSNLQDGKGIWQWGSLPVVGIISGLRPRQL